MENFFVKLQTNKLSLFYRFECLKKNNNIKNYYKRIYHFWEKYKYKVNENATKSEFLNKNEATEILYFLKYKNETYNNLGTNEKEIKEKFLQSYKRIIRYCIFPWYKKKLTSITRSVFFILNSELISTFLPFNPCLTFLHQLLRDDKHIIQFLEHLRSRFQW